MAVFEHCPHERLPYGEECPICMELTSLRAYLERAEAERDSDKGVISRLVIERDALRRELSEALADNTKIEKQRCEMKAGRDTFADSYKFFKNEWRKAMDENESLMAERDAAVRELDERDTERREALQRLGVDPDHYLGDASDYQLAELRRRLRIYESIEAEVYSVIIEVHEYGLSLDRAIHRISDAIYTESGIRRTIQADRREGDDG